MYLFEADKNVTFKTHKRYSNYSINESHFSRKNYPATGIVIVTPSNTILSIILEDMRNSIWWNHEARFLIAYQDVDNGCHMARLVLSTVWAFNILSAVYLCFNPNSQLMLYTFNPYTSLAPKFWNKVQDDDSLNKRWTLFRHSFESLQSLESWFTNGEKILLLLFLN